MGLQFSITLRKCHLSYLNIFLHIPYSESPNTHIFILSHMPLSFHSYFLPFYSLWFSLDSLYCCVLLPSSFILQCLVFCVINPNVHTNTIFFSFRSLICLFFLVFLPVYFYASLSILILGV